MTQPNWIAFGAAQTVTTPTKTLWIKVCDYVRGPRKLKIEATGTWGYDAGANCSADGDPGQGFSDSNLQKSATRGSLIAKIGGGAGDSPGSEKIFAVGSFSIFDIGDMAGPLFLSMNDDPKNFFKHTGSLNVTISHAP